MDSTKKEGAWPKIRPRLKTATTMPPPTPKSPTSPASTYMLAVQSLDPRPLEELHHERAYLLHDLQKQGARATRLFHRYAAVEARLAGCAATATPAETKKCKKEASLVRAKIAESTQQEQLILLRLGEIHVELQNRDWMLVHQHQLQQQQQHQQQVFSWQPPPPLVYPPPQPLMSIGEVCCLSPCQERQPPPQLQHRHHPSHPEKEEEEQTTPTTATTDRPSSASVSAPTSPDYFSSSCGSGSAASGSAGSVGSMSMLSPLSPCFTPGTVFFAEDIWARAAAAASESKSKDKGEGEGEESEKGTGTGTGTPMAVMVTTTTTTTSTMIEEGGGVGPFGVGGGVVEGGGGEERKGVKGMVVSVDHQEKSDSGRRLLDDEVEKGEWTEVGRGDGGREQSVSNDGAAHAHNNTPMCDSDAEDMEEEEEDTQAWSDRLRRVSLYFPGSLKAKDKRMSLPYLKGMWSRSRRNSLQSTAG